MQPYIIKALAININNNISTFYNKAEFYKNVRFRTYPFRNEHRESYKRNRLGAVNAYSAQQMDDNPNAGCKIR